VVEEQRSEQNRQHEDVHRVEADERGLLDGAPADQQLADHVSHPRDRSGDVGADSDGPEGKLVPGKQVARE
jgi:hypothetical protein